MKEKKESCAKKEEDKSYAQWFALTALLLLLFGGWAIWREAIGLRPWKEYQKEYYKLERARLLSNLKQLVARQNEMRDVLARSAHAPDIARSASTGEKAQLVRVSMQGQTKQSPIEQEMRELDAQKAALERKLEQIRQSEVSIKQIYLPELGRADRCQSCHVAIDRADSVFHQQPYTSHPGSFLFLGKHSPDRFGCTVCHAGQGRATTAPEKAHGQVRYWLEPMLAGPYSEASCLKCHKDPSSLRGAEKLQKGLELLKRYACHACHKIAGYENLPRVGPPLTEVGKKVNYSWLVKWIKNPRSVIPDARMPNFDLSDEDAHAVADFLFRFTQSERTDYLAPKVDPELAEQGRTLYNTSRCGICHRASERGGEFKEVYATDLSFEGSKVQQLDWLIGRVREPKKYFPETVMPRYRLTEPELRALASYMASEFIDSELEVNKRVTPEPIVEHSVVRGRELVSKYGCYNCHEIRGFEKEGKIGPELSTVGSKSLERFDFGRTQITRSHESWFKTKLKTPRVFSADLKMPNYQLPDEEIGALTTVLLGLTGEKLPSRYVVPSSASDFTLAGDVGRLIDDVKCLTCHSIRGRGGKFAPDLSFEGSAAEEAWLKGFLRAPDIIRPLLKQMPKFNLTDREVSVLAQFIKTTLVDERILEESWPELSSGQAIQQGRDIYQRNGCRACHQIGQAGGAVGPDLTAVGNRLTPGYLLERMKNARAFRPNIVEPHYGFSDAEAAAVARYLKSLQKLERMAKQGGSRNAR